jgi:sulfatase modifying factor 1
MSELSSAECEGRWQRHELFISDTLPNLDRCSRKKPFIAEKSMRDRSNRCSILAIVTAAAAGIGFALAAPSEVWVETIVLDLGGGEKIEFVGIEPGEFLMGSLESDKDAYDNEKPLHLVRITKPFYLAKEELKRGQFRRFVDDDGYKTLPERDGEGGWGYNAATNEIEGRKPQYTWKNAGFEQTDSHPVVNVTWTDAMAYCEWLTKKAVRQVQLPTEAQWEYACRAGSKTKYSYGDDGQSMWQHGNSADKRFANNLPAVVERIKKVIPDYAPIASDDGYIFTAPVGRYKANANGLNDMHGIVWEWCLDGPRTYKDQKETDPIGPTDTGSNRAFRGGSWYNSARVCRSATRGDYASSSRNVNLGFRPALVPSDK